MRAVRNSSVELLEAGFAVLIFFKFGHCAHLYKQISEMSKRVDQLHVKMSYLGLLACTMPHGLAHPIVTFFFPPACSVAAVL